MRETLADSVEVGMGSYSGRNGIAMLVVLLSLGVGAGAARAEDFSSYSGVQLYARFCASCHGAEGRGDGVVAGTFKVMVPDLTRISRRQGGTFPEGQIRRIIDGRKVLPPHGSRAMPVWGFEFASQTADKPGSQQNTQQMVERLTEYIRSIQQK